MASASFCDDLDTQSNHCHKVVMFPRGDSHITVSASNNLAGQLKASINDTCFSDECIDNTDDLKPLVDVESLCNNSSHIMNRNQTATIRNNVNKFNCDNESSQGLVSDNYFKSNFVKNDKDEITIHSSNYSNGKNNECGVETLVNERNLSEKTGKQKRKARKPVKSSIRYHESGANHVTQNSSLQLTPPQTSPSPTPPGQPPLSPPLSDAQSSLSNLSPCSSVNSDEKHGRALLPRLLPITDPSEHSAVFVKKAKLDNLSLHDDEKVSNSEDSFPPPPPYPKENVDSQSPNPGLSSCLDNELLGKKAEVDERPPPPSYHSHFISRKDDATNTQKLLQDERGSFSLKNSFWSSVNLPASLSVSAVTADKLCQRNNEETESEEDKCSEVSCGSSAYSSSTVAMLLQQLASAQQRSNETAEQISNEHSETEDCVESEASAESSKTAKNTIDINIDNSNLTSVLNKLISKTSNSLCEASKEKSQSEHNTLLPAKGHDPLESTLPETLSLPGSHLILSDNASRETASDLSSEKSVATSSSSDSLQHSNVTAALIAAAALQNTYGGNISSIMMENPFSRLLMSGNSSGGESSSPFSPGTTPTSDLSHLAESGRYSGYGVSKSELLSENLQANLESYQKLLSESTKVNNLNNIAAISYFLQQQQFESLGLSGASSSNASSLSGLSSLNSLNNMPGISGLVPSDSSHSLQEMLKNMHYLESGSGMSRRRPRSNNHTKSFHCSLCSKRFSLKDELEEHMLTHTSDELGNESYMQKSFACTECSFRTKYKFCLQRHMHIHSGEKPLVCPYCRYRSISKVSYDNHIRTHTGEKPFACPYCSYKSSFKNNLTKHIKTHTGSNKPYTCNKCSSCFSSQIQLKAHMRLHTEQTDTHNCIHCLYTCMSRFELECHMRTHVSV